MEARNPLAAALDAFDGGATWYEHEFLAIVRREEFAQVPERQFEEAAFQLCRNHRRDLGREWAGHFVLCSRASMATVLSDRASPS